MTYASEVAADSPYIWLRLGDADDTLVDSGSGGFTDIGAGEFNAITYNVTGLQTSDGDGAIRLSTGDIIAGGTDFSAVSLAPYTAFTFEALVNLTDFDDGTLVGFVADTGLHVDSTGHVYGASWDSGFGYHTTTPYPLAVNTTYHLAVTFDGATGDLKMYVNGALVDTNATGEPTFILNGSPQYFHGFRGWNDLLAGTIDEDAWYRTALSAARIAAHAIAAGFSPPVNTPPVVGSLAPNYGIATGGDIIVITGTDFTDVTSVAFGGIESPSWTVDSDTQITATTPAHSLGFTSAAVTTEWGSDSGSFAFTFDGNPPVAPTSTCVGLALGTGFLADGATADADGIVYTPTLVGGWWDSIPLTSATAELQPRGETITVAQELGREIALEIVAHSPIAGTPLGPVLCFTAMETIKAAFRVIFVPVAFRVVDPFADRTLLARRVGPIKQTILGDSAVVVSQIPLLGEDPRRVPA